MFSDIETSIRLIEENLGSAPLFFAYPGGQTDSWAKEFIKEHFAVTVITRHGPADLSKGLYSLRRHNISLIEGVEDFLPA